MHACTDSPKTECLQQLIAGEGIQIQLQQSSKFSKKDVQVIWISWRNSANTDQLNENNSYSSSKTNRLQLLVSMRVTM